VLGQEVVDAALKDYRTAPIPERTRAAMELLEKMTLRPEELGAADIARARAAGVTRQAALEAFQVGYCFNTITRVADGLGFSMQTPAEFAADARMLLKRGYR
jgi:alkylhydroperoxidase family enzyme